MTKPRKKIGLKTKLAATLCQMVKPNDTGRFERVIPHDLADVALATDSVIALVAEHTSRPLFAIEPRLTAVGAMAAEIRTWIIRQQTNDAAASRGLILLRSLDNYSKKPSDALRRQIAANVASLAACVGR